MVTAIDIGNSYSVMFDGRKTYRVRSLVAHPSTKRNTRNGTGVIEYNDSLYHTGESALRYDIFTDMATSDKQQSIDDCVVLALNLITPNRGRLPDTVELVIQVPDTSTDYGNELVKQLNGFKSWKLDGKAFNTKISVVNVFQEGYGSWFMGSRTGILAEGYTLVVDLGAGTAIATLIDNVDTEVLKTFSYKAKGVSFLANLLRQDYELRHDNNGDVISVEMLFRAFEHEDLRIGSNGTSIRPYMPIYVKQWWSSIWADILSSYKPQFDRREITKVLITGGGAFLVKPYIEAANKKVPGFFTISNDPLYDNVKGIYHAHVG